MKSKTLKTIVFLIAATLPLCSCQKEIKYMHAGDGVRFTAGSGFAQTKASYSGATNSAGTIERIDWQAGDLMRIYCAQASEPAQKFADYKVTSVDSPASGSAVSTAHIETFSDETDGVGLRWGEGAHTFYAAFPSPATTGGITTSISGNEVSANLSGSQTPASVTTSGVNYTAVADLKNMLMTAKAGPYTAETMPDENSVFLAFTPLTTAVKFTITNQSKADLIIKSVSLISASSALNGPFTVDIDDESHQPESVNLGGTTVTYSQTYPYCQYTGTVSDATKKVTINFATPVTLAYDANIANCGSLTFTFFLQPCDNFNDLTFKLVKSDDSWMTTKLGYTDDTGILFPRFKKTEVKGVFVPEGAQWTVKYNPTVQSWDQSSSEINPMPETEGDPLVTSWDTGIDDELELNPVPDPYNGHEYVEIAAKYDGTNVTTLKWATCNVGASSPKEYGWYFFWAGTEGYVRDSGNSKWVKASDPTSELSGGFNLENTPYHTGSTESTGWTKYIPTGKLKYWSGDGSPDNKTVLDPEDDAARVNWGGSWRMPTSDEFNAMIGATYWAWNSAAKGYYVFSPDETHTAGTRVSSIPSDLNKDSALLFFPATGESDNASIRNRDFIAYYWTSSLWHGYPYLAFCFQFDNGFVRATSSLSRYYGQSVRPVAD